MQSKSFVLFPPSCVHLWLAGASTCNVFLIWSLMRCRSKYQKLKIGNEQSPGDKKAEMEADQRMFQRSWTFSWFRPFCCIPADLSIFCSSQRTCWVWLRTGQSDELEGGTSVTTKVRPFKYLSHDSCCFFLWVWLIRLPSTVASIFSAIFPPWICRYLEEVGYSDTILDMRSKRVRSLLGRSSPESNGPPPSESCSEPEPRAGGESLLVRQIEEQIKRWELSSSFCCSDTLTFIDALHVFISL